MRVYRKSRGEGRRSATWTIAFRDARRVQRHLATGLSEKSTAEAWARMLARLLDAQTRADAPPLDVTRWIERLPREVSLALGKWGVLERGHVAAAKTLDEHADDWGRSMVRRGATERHRSQTIVTLRRLLDRAGMVHWSELDAARLEDALHALMAERDLGRRTANHYIEAVRTFAGWMLREGRATANPVTMLRRLPIQGDKRVVRRDATEDELRALLAAAYAGPPVLGVPGPLRALCYGMAAWTGLRVSELAGLRVADLELDGSPPTLTVRAEIAKNRQEARVVLVPEVVDRLRRAVSGSLPSAPALPGLPVKRMAELVRFDLRAAGVPFLDPSGRRLDFHALRHTAATRMARTAGVNATQRHLRHSTPALTFGVYGHTSEAEIAGALAALPPLWAPAEPRAMAQEGAGPVTPIVTSGLSPGVRSGPHMSVGRTPNPPSFTSRGPPGAGALPARTTWQPPHVRQVTAAMEGRVTPIVTYPDLLALARVWPSLSPEQRAEIARLAGLG